jgi:hypothetical protein
VLLQSALAFFFLLIYIACIALVLNFAGEIFKNVNRLFLVVMAIFAPLTLACAFVAGVVLFLVVTPVTALIRGCQEAFGK